MSPGSAPWVAIAAHIAAATGRPFTPARAPRPVGGGCINSAAILGDGEHAYFVKTNGAECLVMFEAEAAGLLELAAAAALRVPTPVCWGTSGPTAYLVLERLDLSGAAPGAVAGAAAGRALAELHRTAAATHGWSRDNFIGSTPQPNTPCTDWTAFWRERRLGFQLALAERNGHGRALTDAGLRLLADLDPLLAHAPRPALLHGDLWGGNIGWLPDGEPVVYDPAVYFGDREADLAMTELFGGFGADFHAAYREAWPLDPGYRVRKTLYNLYHILNHLNLFGSAYLGQARGMIERLHAEVR